MDAVLIFAHDRIERAMQFYARCHRRFHHTASPAVRTILVNCVAEAFLRALPRHFHQAEGRDRKHMSLGFIALQLFLHQVVDHLLVFTAFHVDEVGDDQAANIAQSKLTRDFIRCFQVRLQNRFLDVASTFVTAGIHINRHQRFRLVYHNVAAALEPDLPMEGVIDLLLHAIGFENWRRAIVKVNSIACSP